MVSDFIYIWYNHNFFVIDLHIIGTASRVKQLGIWLKIQFFVICKPIPAVKPTQI